MPVDILMPALSPTMEEGTLAKWLVKEGDEVSSGDLLAEIETDKATMEFEAVDEGKVVSILIPEGTNGVRVNTPIAVLLGEGEDVNDIVKTPASPATSEAPTTQTAPTASTQPTPAVAPIQSSADGGRVFASPLARRIAKEFNLELTRIKGSGPRGRIVEGRCRGSG